MLFKIRTEQNQKENQNEPKNQTTRSRHASPTKMPKVDLEPRCTWGIPWKKHVEGSKVQNVATSRHDERR